MKTSVHLALLLLATWAAPASLRAQVPASDAVATNGIGPRMQFNTESYDFGTNLVGDPVRFTFVVTNTGDAMLEITDVHPGCSCTVVAADAAAKGGGPGWTKEIPPKGTGVIPIQINTGALKGRIIKPVTITSNDRERPTMSVQLHGVVWMPIEVVPANANFSLFPGSTTNSTVTVHISNRTDAPLALSPPTSNTNIFSAVLKTNVPGREFDLVVTSVPTSALPSAQAMLFLQGEITMTSSAKDEPLVKVPVFASVQPELQVAPLQIQPPPGPLPRPMTNWVIIRGNVNRPLTVSDPAINVPGATVTVLTMQTNRQYALVVVLPAGFEAKPGGNSVITVKSDNPHYSTIGIPVVPMSGVLPTPPASGSH